MFQNKPLVIIQNISFAGFIGFFVVAGGFQSPLRTSLFITACALLALAGILFLINLFAPYPEDNYSPRGISYKDEWEMDRQARTLAAIHSRSHHHPS